MHRDTLAAAATMGIDLADHVSRAVEGPLLHDDGADLIVAMSVSTYATWSHSTRRCGAARSP